MTALKKLLAYSALRFVLLLLTQATTVQAQQPVVELYRVRILTKEGHRLRGTLEDIDSSFVYVGGSSGGYVPLQDIMKVVLRRNNKKRIQLVGVVIGGTLAGYLANEGLQKSPTRSAVLHGLTVGFSAVGGAATGLLAASLIGNANSRVIRPSGDTNSTISLYRELNPFSQRFQRDMINHLNTSRQR